MSSNFCNRREQCQNSTPMRNATLITQRRYFGPLNYKIKMPQSTAMESRTQALLTCGLSIPSVLQHARWNAQSPKDIFWRREKTHRATLPQEKPRAYWTSLSLIYKPSLQEIRSSLRTSPNNACTTGTNALIDQIQGVCRFCTSDNCGILCRKLPRSWMWRMYDSPWSERLLGRMESPLGRKRQMRDPKLLWWTPQLTTVLNRVMLSECVLKFNTTSNSFSKIQRQKQEEKMYQQIDKQWINWPVNLSVKKPGWIETCSFQQWLLIRSRLSVSLSFS